MAKLDIARDNWYCYFPLLTTYFDPVFSHASLELTENEERWIVEAYKEWQEVQKFLAAKIEGDSNGKQ